MTIPKRTWRGIAKSVVTFFAYALGLGLLAVATLYGSILVLPVLIWHM